jgi:hypothetical protein
VESSSNKRGWAPGEASVERKATLVIGAAGGTFPTIAEQLGADGTPVAINYAMARAHCIFFATFRCLQTSKRADHADMFGLKE